MWRILVPLKEAKEGQGEKESKNDLLLPLLLISVMIAWLLWFCKKVLQQYICDLCFVFFMICLSINVYIKVSSNHIFHRINHKKDPRDYDAGVGETTESWMIWSFFFFGILPILRYWHLGLYQGKVVNTGIEKSGVWLSWIQKLIHISSQTEYFIFTYFAIIIIVLIYHSLYFSIFW